MAYILFWFLFGCSFNHIFSTLLPSNQFLDQLRMHDYNPINRLSMICFKDHHSTLITKILHLILLVNNWQNGTILLTYFNLIFFMTHPPLVLYMSRTLFAISTNATLTSDISIWSNYVSSI
jgi:hypothetical protein